jgi:hypothetical protein
LLFENIEKDWALSWWKMMLQAENAMKQRLKLPI